MAAAEPGGRRRLGEDLAEPDHDSRCTVRSWSRMCQLTTVTELSRNDSLLSFR